MAPFTFNSLTETFLVLMNTPLVKTESSTALRDVPLTDMPTRQGERRRSSSSTRSSSTQSSLPSSDSHSGAHYKSTHVHVIDLQAVNEALQTKIMSESKLYPTPLLYHVPSDTSKKLPPLPTNHRHNSHVHFADDVRDEGY